MEKTKNLIKILTIILLVSVILRFCFVIVHFNHNCTHDDNCPICTLIHNFKNDLNGFNPSLVEIVIAMLVLFPPIAIYLNNRTTDKKEYTLIGLKVELIN